MMLVEIIRGRETGDRAVAKALDFVRQIRKTPIVVNDARFFYANRCIIPYINEGVRMVAEGVEPALIENAAKQLGFPLGPLQLVDETSIDLGVKIAKATKAAMGDAYPGEPGRRRPLPARRPAAGSGARPRPASTPTTTPASARASGRASPSSGRRAPTSPRFTEVQHRLAMVQTLEAVRALEEGVLTDIREGDVGAILGWGYMPWSGGPFSWLDILGAGQGGGDLADDRLAARLWTWPALRQLQPSAAAATCAEPVGRRPCYSRLHLPAEKARLMAHDHATDPAATPASCKRRGARRRPGDKPRPARLERAAGGPARRWTGLRSRRMTALDRYVRLEAVGLWRPGPGAARPRGHRRLRPRHHRADRPRGAAPRPLGARRHGAGRPQGRRHRLLDDRRRRRDPGHPRSAR